MNKLKILAAIALCMAYAAGIATGWAGYILADEKPPPPPGDRGSWLSQTLQLNEDQRVKLEEIWSPEADRRDGDDARTRIRALYDERNAQVRALLTEEQQAQFDEIYRVIEEKKDAIAQERQARHEEAVKKTMAILTPDQQAKYQKILDDFEKKDPKRDRGAGDWRTGPGDRH
jgi:Spy/CpxP family protein refolding chaperone